MANSPPGHAESYRLLNGPAWSPDGKYLVGRKHFTSRRSLGAEMWMYHRDALAPDATGGVPLTSRESDQKCQRSVFPRWLSIYYSQDVTPGSDFEYDKDSVKGICDQALQLSSGETETLLRGSGEHVVQLHRLMENSHL